MGFLSSLLGILGFAIGSLIGLVIGFYFFIYSEPEDVQDPPITPLHELDATALQDLMPEIPFWVKSPDYERVDWLNKFILELWPFLDKEICNTIRSIAEPIFADYIGMLKIQSIDFEKMSIGTIPPTIHGLKVYETNENELVMEPAIKWAGNPNMLVAVALSSQRITIQFVEIQVYAALRITMKPLVPTFPCFSKIVVSLLGKPKIDFGLKVMGGDIMSIPGLYRYIQNSIKREVAKLYLWPQALEIPILDDSAFSLTGYA